MELKMEKILEEALIDFGLEVDPEAFKLIYSVFKQPQSLDEKFLEEIRTRICEIGEEDYCSVLQTMMTKEKLVTFKGAELLETWMAYQIGLRLKCNISINERLDIIRKTFKESKFPVLSCAEKIMRKQYKSLSFNEFKEWRKTNASKLEEFDKFVTSNQLYQSLMMPKKEVKPQVVKLPQEEEQQMPPPEQFKPLKKEEQKQVSNQQSMQFARLQFQRQGKLIKSEYDSLKPYENLIEFEILKHIMSNFMQIYQLMQNHNDYFLKLFTKQLPLTLIPMQELKQRLQKEQRPIPKTLGELEMKTNNNSMDKEISVEGLMDMYRLWCSLKDELNILNIFLMNSLIKNTEESTNHIKDKHILFLIGPSGAGKTTIILRLLNYELQETKIHQLPTLVPKQPLKPEHTELITSPEAKSTTKYIFSAKINEEFVEEREVQINGKDVLVREDLYLCDTPGFFDTSGAVVDVANGVGMINAVKCAKSVKPVVVISAKMVGEKFEGIKEIAKIVSDLFSEYRKPIEGASTEFIFNKFTSNEQFARLEPGVANILNNLTANEQSDGKYVRFLQVLWERLKKKRNEIIRFDPFTVDLKSCIGKLSRNPIQKPDGTFRYSFSSKSALSLKNYFQNKLNIINNLLSINISHASYHIKELQTLLALVPNEDYKDDFDNLIRRICSTSREYFMRFKSILHEDVLRNEASSMEIEELKQIHKTLKLFTQFNDIPEIEVYQEQDLLNLIENVTQKLRQNIKSVKFTNNRQTEFKKALKIINSFSSNFNPELLQYTKKYLKKKYDQTKIEIQRLSLSNSFTEYQELHEIYDNICNYNEMFEQPNRKIKRSIDILNEKYERVKTPAEAILQQIKSYFEKQEENQETALSQKIIDLDGYYNSLECMQSMNINSNIKQENFKGTIIKELTELISESLTKCEEIIGSKTTQKCSIIVVAHYRDYLISLKSFKKLKEQSQMNLKSINNMIRRLIDLQSSNLQKITHCMIKDCEFNPRIANLDLIMFRIQNYSKFIDFSQKNQLIQLQDDFRSNFLQSIDNIIQRVENYKVNIRGTFKQEQVHSLIKRLHEYKYLNSIKTLYSEGERASYQAKLEKFHQTVLTKLKNPFREINLSFTGAKVDKQKLFSKKLLHELSFFIEYQQFLGKTMNTKDYDAFIKFDLKQQYEKNIQAFMNLLYDQLLSNFERISEKNDVIYNFDRKGITAFKKLIDIFFFSINNQNIAKQINRLEYFEKFTIVKDKIFTLLEASQRQLKDEFYKHKNSKTFEEDFQRIRTNCCNMKEFDSYLDENNKFSEILELIQQELLKRQGSVSNRLVCIFNEESINYPVLLEFYLSNKNNPEIVQEIIEKIKAYDRKLHEEIEGLNKYVEDIIFEDDNINYIKLMMSAYEFNSESKFILENRPEKDTLTINDSYFKESLNVFVNNYENFYQKIMEEICKLKYKASIPSKITFLFEGLEVLISKFFPQDYERIKTNICNMSFNEDLSIENPLNEDSKIYTRIERINNTLKRDLESDCTKVLNIFNPNSKKYYEKLDSEQMKRYESRLQEEFNKQIKFFYEKSTTNGTNEVDQEKIQKILKLIPQQKMLFQLENEFKSIKKKVNADRDTLILNFQREVENREFNFDKMTRIYKQMNRKDQDKCKQELSRSIEMDFKYLEELHIDIEKWSIRYKEMRQKYENSSILNEQPSFFNVYNDARREFESFISKKIDQLIKRNIDNLFRDLSDSSFNQIKETNLTIMNLYYFSIQEKGNDFFKLLADKSENYIINLIKEYEKPSTNELRTPIHQCSLKNLEDYLKEKYYLVLLLDSIFMYIIQKEKNIKQFRKSNELFNLIEKYKNIRESIEIIATQIGNTNKDASTFTFSNLINQLSMEVSVSQKAKQLLEQLMQKISFLLKIQPIFRRYNLYAFDNNMNSQYIAQIETFKTMFNQEVEFAMKEVKSLKQGEHIEISIRHNLIVQFCEVLKSNSNNEKEKFQFIKTAREKLDENLRLEVDQILKEGFFSEGKKGLNVVTSKKYRQQGFDTNNIEAASKVIENLILMEKLSSKIDFFSQYIDERSKSMISSIKQRGLMNVVLKVMKEYLEYPEIKSIIGKNKVFQPVLYEEFYQDTKRSFEDFFTQLNKKCEGRLNFQKIQKYYDICQQSFTEMQYQYERNPGQETVKAICKKIADTVSKDGQPQVVGKIFALYSIIKSRQVELDLQFRPHCAQVIAIHLLLENIDSEDKFKNTLVEILTGEGKSIVLAGAACYLALKGYKVYQVCYSKYLVQRDYEQFKNLFRHLQVEKFIQYNIFTDVCKKIISKSNQNQNFEEFIKTELQKGRFQNFKDKLLSFGKFFINLFGKSSQDKEIILMDEIDVLFSEDFEGKIYNQILHYYDTDNNKQIQKILQLIHKQTTKQIYLSFSTLKETDQYQNLIKKYSNIRSIIKEQVKLMLSDSLDDQKIKQLQKVLSSAQDDEYDETRGYKECFAYLRLKDQGKKNENEIKKKMRISLKIGQFSYCEIPKYFSKVIGVSGTLECLSETNKALLMKEHKINNFYYFPSIYNKKACKELSPYQGIDQYRVILRKIEDYFNDSTKKKALLIFFKDIQALNEFKKFIPRPLCAQLKINFLAERQTKQNYKRISQFIMNVMTPNTLTLATKQYTRGIDFKDFSLSQGLFVIQTYFPQSFEDYKQSKGRTARAGKQGSYQLILQSQQIKYMQYGKDNITEDMKAFQNIWNINNKKAIQLRKKRRDQAQAKHDRTLKIYDNGDIKQFIQEINKIQYKQVLIIFGFQGSMPLVKEMSEFLMKMLEQYEKCIKNYELSIKPKYQLCFYGNYNNLQKNTDSIFKKNQISNDISALKHFQSKFIKLERFSRLDSSKRAYESDQLFLRHIVSLSEEYTINSVFLWKHDLNYKWNLYQTTTEYKLYKKKYDVQKIKNTETSEELLNSIKRKKILMNIIGTNAELTAKREAQQYGKNSSDNYQFLPTLDQKKLRTFMFQRVKEVIPQFKFKAVRDQLQP